jgi:hypothetical protein
MVDEITGIATGNVVSNPMTVALPEVPVGVPHQFTVGTLTEDTTISFRVRSKDNNGSYSSGSTVTFTGLFFNQVVASGGTIGYYSLGGISYKSHTFTTSGPLTVTSGGDFGILVVGAGGAGGSGDNVGGGGGGGGEVFESANSTLLPGEYAVEIGSGGAMAPKWQHSTNGSYSRFAKSGFTDIIALGGGRGGTAWAPNYNSDGSSSGTGGADGGCGGGASGWGSATAQAGQSLSQGGDWHGFQGGLSKSNWDLGSGSGGGAGSAGGPNYNGGIGHASDISGSSAYYAGGGGAGNNSGGKVGGLGGGGHGYGNNTFTHITPGAVNTGGGGGSGGNTSGGNSVSSGGSGIVIVRYPI